MSSLGWPSTIHSAACGAGAAAEHDPEDREAREHVQVAHARHRPDQAAAVGRVAVRAVDQRPAARRRRTRGSARAAATQHVLDQLESRRQQPPVEALGDAVERPRRRLRLERADEQRLALLPGVERALGIAQDRQLPVELRNHLDRLGHDVVVLQRHDRQLDAGQPAHLRAPTDPAALTTMSARSCSVGRVERPSSRAPWSARAPACDGGSRTRARSPRRPARS